MTHRLVTDEAVEVARLKAEELAADFFYKRNEEEEEYSTEAAREVIEAFVVHIEGKRVCPSCVNGWVDDVEHPTLMGQTKPCPICKGEGTVRERRLLTLGPEDDEKITKAILNHSTLNPGATVAETACAVREVLMR